MAKALMNKQTLTVAATATNYMTSAIDTSAYNSCAVQVNGVGAGAGTLTVQISNDGTNWFTLGTATIASGTIIYNSGATLIGAQLLRAMVNVSGGTGSYDILTSLKEV
jgi:hypothetical protein